MFSSGITWSCRAGNFLLITCSHQGLLENVEQATYYWLHVLTVSITEPDGSVSGLDDSYMKEDKDDSTSSATPSTLADLTASALTPPSGAELTPSSSAGNFMAKRKRGRPRKIKTDMSEQPVPSPEGNY